MFRLLNPKFLFVLLLLGIGGFVFYKYIFIGGLSPQETMVRLTKDVKGASTNVSIDPNKASKSIKTPLGNVQVAGSLGSLQQEVGKLTSKEVASSSPQIQKIIQELQTLQTASGSPVRTMCQQVCSNLQ